ncbi:phosphoribosyltransferase family protein [Pararhizobium sp. YC-54]|uniref:orotate phosphoribosyltransferase n=1 Tax=Pararhizobium sp. YC-54 TaxID=2986920 RepID=UPI0021F79652|nr:phosphoribosyltransferase family protein [Pararhizobium sp. YC-54]MCV9999357.1 phosphoribosyltransferase family protein [Pararhizobium sp. YC-54]
MTNPAGAQITRLLFECHAVGINRDQPYVLAGGWASPVYVDVRLLIAEQTVRKAITRLATEYLGTNGVNLEYDAIAGAETAGIPFATLLADATQKPLRYVRKKPLGIGRNAQVEGGNVEGMRVLLMDDMTTDATIKGAFVKGLRAAGAVVTDILTVFFYDVFPGVDTTLMESGVNLHSLATWSDVLRYAPEEAMSADDRQELEQFLRDPVRWSAWHGGRSTARF